MVPGWLRVVVALSFLAAGCFVATRPAWSGVREQAAQHHLLQRLAEGPADPGPVAAPGPGGLYGELRIPRIGLVAAVLDGATLTDYSALLAQGPAHLAGSAAPGAVGNAVIFGHRDIDGSPFGRLHELHAGDLIVVAAPGGSVDTYTVTSVTAVAPADLAPIAPLSLRALTLITCTGPENSQRLVVRAVLDPGVSNPQQKPA